MQKNINDIILELMPAIIARAQELTGDNTFNINYQAGHITEICQNLQDMTNEKYESYKFPLIALILDFRERKGFSMDIYSEAYPNILIATNTVNTLKAHERYEKTFKPVLYPIYEAFIEVIGESKYFLGYNPWDIPHSKIDRMFLGKEGIYGNEGNTYNDYIDAIEIRDLRLQQNLIPNCENTNTWQH